MIKKFDHVGLVVNNTEGMVTLLSNLFRFEVTESITFSEQGFKSTLVSRGGVTLELIEPGGGEGIIQTTFIHPHSTGGILIELIQRPNT